MRRGGALITFEIKGGKDNTKAFTSSLKKIHIAESLGGCETKICVPGLMTHLSVPPEERVKLGITDTLIRLSVGIENINDLLEELENSLLNSQNVNK